jgi:DNA-binding XRE family transcriptional regulator
MPQPTTTLPHVRAWRVHRLLTQAQLAQQAGLHPWTVTTAEANKPVSLLTAERLARALGVTVADLQQKDPTP